MTEDFWIGVAVGLILDATIGSFMHGFLSEAWKDIKKWRQNRKQ